MGLNGDTKMILERIDNLKEYVKDWRKENQYDHQSIFKLLNTHTSSIAQNKTFIIAGGAILAVIVTVLINILL
mgnify:CR=1 FL=1